ncbi:MAG: GNAT family N-acetyltransferase [Xanthomonadales bacterium]|nr:GNAT family N-acetyltransferase [Xanthomonadales bacterium]
MSGKVARAERLERSAGSSDATVEYGPLQTGDRRLLDELCGRVLDAPGRVLELRRWLERHPVAGLARRNVVARCGGRLVGAMTVVPIEVRGGGQSLKAAWQQDSAVDPEFRRRGIATGLIDAAAAGLDLVMVKGTSRAMAEARRAAGFVDVTPSDFLVRVLRPRGMPLPGLQAAGFLLSRLRSRTAVADDPEVRRDESLDERFDALDSERTGRPVLAVRRSATLLQARYRELPGRDYRILTLAGHNRVRGAVVLRPPPRPGGVAWLVDLIWSQADSGVEDRLLGAAVREAHALEAGLLAAFASDRRARKALARWGFLRTHRSPRFLVRAQNERAARLVGEFGFDVWHGDGDLEMSEEMEETQCKARG